jgi:O-antigen/teichoic acid export membrane protein
MQEVTSSIPSTPKGLSFRKNFSWTFIGNLMYSLFQWVILTIIVKLGTKEDLGVFGLATAICAPIILFASLQLRMLLATDAKREYDFSDYLTLRFLTSILAILVIVLTGMVSVSWNEVLLVVILTGLSKYFETMSEIYHGYFQIRDRMDLVAYSMIYRGILNCIFVAISYLIWQSITAASVGLVLAGIVMLSFYDRAYCIKLAKDDPQINKDSFRLNYNWSKLKQLVIMSLPLGGVILSTTLQVNVPRYFIQGYMGEGMLGIFVALSYLLVIGQTFVLALVRPSSTTLSRYYANGNRRAFIKLTNRLIILIGGIGFLGVFFSLTIGKELLTLLYTSEYADYSKEFVIIMIAGSIRQVSLVLGAANTACKALKEQAIPAVLELVAITVGCWLLVPNYGLMGAGYALLILSLLSVFFRLVILARSFSNFKTS